jgi:hypothetical protein
VSGRWIVVADPPHASPAIPAIAKLLGALAIEIRGKVSSPVPEPVSVLAGEAEALELARALTAAGLASHAIPARDLGTVPPPDEVVAFELLPDGIAWTASRGRRTALWSEVRAVVSYRREGEASARGAEVERSSPKIMERPGKAGAERPLKPLRGAHDDVLEIGVLGAAPLRARFASRVGWDGLGPLKQATGALNWQTLVAHVAEKVRPLALDRRGEQAGKLRPTTIGGVGLAKTFEGEPEPVVSALGDPHAFLAAFVCLRSGVRSGFAPAD